MSDKIDTAVRSMKAVGTEITQWENRLDSVRAEHDRTLKAKEALQAEIDRKTSDYQIFIAQRDSETKRIRQSTMEDSEQLAKDKKEFSDILAQFKKDKSNFEHEQNSTSAEWGKIKAQKEAIQGFISAVQRALGLLGL